MQAFVHEREAMIGREMANDGNLYKVNVEVVDSSRTLICCVCG